MAETALARSDGQVTKHFKYFRSSQMLLSKDLNIPSDLTRENVWKPMNESRINPNADDLTERITHNNFPIRMMVKALGPQTHSIS